jgi:hypothetical protein
MPSAPEGDTVSVCLGCLKRGHHRGDEARLQKDRDLDRKVSHQYDLSFVFYCKILKLK